MIIIKRTLFKVSEKAKLLAYIALCCPHVKYAATVWDPNLVYITHEIEMVQHYHYAVRFFSDSKVETA